MSFKPGNKVRVVKTYKITPSRFIKANCQVDVLACGHAIVIHASDAGFKVRVCELCRKTPTIGQKELSKFIEKAGGLDSLKELLAKREHHNNERRKVLAKARATVKPDKKTTTLVAVSA